MHGPEAATIMRNELKYTGKIIGNLVVLFNLLICILVSALFRNHRKCFVARHRAVHSRWSRRNHHQASYKDQTCEIPAELQSKNLTTRSEDFLHVPTALNCAVFFLLIALRMLCYTFKVCSSVRLSHEPRLDYFFYF